MPGGGGGLPPGKPLPSTAVEHGPASTQEAIMDQGKMAAKLANKVPAPRLESQADPRGDLRHPSRPRHPRRRARRRPQRCAARLRYLQDPPALAAERPQPGDRRTADHPGQDVPRLLAGQGPAPARCAVKPTTLGSQGASDELTLRNADRSLGTRPPRTAQPAGRRVSAGHPRGAAGRPRHTRLRALAQRGRCARRARSTSWPYCSTPIGTAR